MAEILVFSERDEIAFELLSKGRELREELGLGLAAALLGRGVEGKSGQYFSYGAEKVYLGESALLADFYVETYAQGLQRAAEEAQVLLLGSTKRGKELASRVAQKLGAGCITDATDLRLEGDGLVADRYALGGNTVASELIKTERKVIAVMPKTFEALPPEAGEGQMVRLELELPEPRVRVVERRAKETEAVNIEEAEALVCIGRGLGAEEDLEMIWELAAALGAEVGCTKSPASDYGWLSEERIVGLSGKKANPSLYVGIGISGQIQHTVGILGSKIIVAINKDPQAPIFKIADYGIVGDLYEVVPRLTERLTTS
jgi:electron transfer flavoprotein alpha subunit